MYEFRDGARTKGLGADVVGEELEKIRGENGGQLRPTDVVTSAKPKAAALHKAFTWDNKAAGDHWRNHEARNLIRSVRVVSEETDDSAAAFVHVRVDGESYYQSTEVAVQSVDEYAAAVTALAEKLHGAQRALEDLKAGAYGQKDTDKALLAGVIAEAFSTANHAISQLSH